jgi:hypothetical protein
MNILSGSTKMELGNFQAYEAGLRFMRKIATALHAIHTKTLRILHADT